MLLWGLVFGVRTVEWGWVVVAAVEEWAGMGVVSLLVVGFGLWDVG